MKEVTETMTVTVIDATNKGIGEETNTNLDLTMITASIPKMIIRETMDRAKARIGTGKEIIPTTTETLILNETGIARETLTTTEVKIPEEKNTEEEILMREAMEIAEIRKTGIAEKTPGARAVKAEEIGNLNQKEEIIVMKIEDVEKEESEIMI